jgi:ParB/RepB/Spo0J family partition protein
MAKKRPRINLSQSIPAQKGDLEKLFSTGADVEQASGLQLLALRLDAISPDPAQPRRTFPEDGLRDLSDSIRQDGVIQPIEVTEVAPNRYMIVHGERRWRAAQLAGLETMPAVVRRRDYDQLTRFVRQLVENIQREDLNDVDRAAGLLHLRELLEQEREAGAAAAATAVDQKSAASHDRPWDNKVTWAKVGKRLGYSRQRIHQLIQLLKLPEEIKQAVREGSLSERDTRIYQGLNQMQQRALHRVHMAGELTPGELRQVVQQLKQEPSRQVIEIVEIVRRQVEPSNELGFSSSFGGDSASRQPAIAPPETAPTADPDWSEKQSSGGRKNALNINRVHWARDHLSRIQCQGLSSSERRELLNVLRRLQQDVATFVESLQEGEAGEIATTDPLGQLAEQRE